MRRSGTDSKENALRFLALFCCLLCLTGCSKKDDKTVELQLNWKAEPQFGGFYAAAEHGLYAKHGLNVTVKQGGAGAPTIELLGAGKVPFAVVSADEIPRAREQGAKIVALFAVYQTHPQGIMTRESRGFRGLEDVFKNAGTLAMERGLPYSDFLRNKYGFDRLKIVPSPFGDLTQYRTEENYAMQCFVTSEPLAAEKAGIKPKTFLIADSGFNPYGTVLATSESYLASNPERVKAMVAAVSEGWRQYLDDATQTNAAMAGQNPAMDAATFAASAEAQKPLIETAETKTVGLGGMTAARWTELLKQLKDLGVISGEVSEASVNACFQWPLK
jgi:NitT/TauT family transport system substrate-binding protein